MTRLLACAALVVSLVTRPAPAGDGNRLAYLDDPVNPYYPGLHFPKLTTPQWVGEEGVEAVVILAIDDMNDNTAKYEEFLRPILNRLKQIDGRAPVSIMANRVKPDDPQLQAWLKEGLSIECHTLTHPCPLLQKGDFDAAAENYHGCVDLMTFPFNGPVAFRMPCCDSMNTPSPRFYAEIFNRSSPGNRFLSIDSSVFCLLTPDDPDLPRELVLEPDGRERFRKYLPFKSFVNTIENYPYPYVIGNLCWEFPSIVPSDWEAQNILKPANPKLVEDWKAALDAVVIKQGVMTLTFHPYGWSTSEQIVELIDHANAKYGKRIKFMTFREAYRELGRSLLGGWFVRRPGLVTHDGGVRLIDLNDDSYMDVVQPHHSRRVFWLWDPVKSRPTERRGTPFMNIPLIAGQFGPEQGLRFGIIHPDGRPIALISNDTAQGGWQFNGQEWIEDASLLEGLETEGQPFLTAVAGHDMGVRLRDIDGDGGCELIIGNDRQNAVFRRTMSPPKWERLPFTLPDGARIVDKRDTDAGMRFVDLDEDGALDLVFSNEEGFGVYLFESMTKGWSRRVLAGPRNDPNALPLIVRDGTNNGFWVHSRSLWWQNEDTAQLPDKVDRRSFNDLLRDTLPRAKAPEASLKSIRVRPGFRVELVAAEPLVQDPVAFDWSADGRLWVVEMGDYPLGEDGKGKPGGRVRVLEDTDKDGKYDKATIFLEGLVYPNGIMCWRDGVLISCAPDIFHAVDTDGDGKADQREVLFTGFDEANPQHRVNGFDLGLDGWVYAADAESKHGVKSLKTGETHAIRGRDFRFDPDSGRLELESGRGQFGRRRDDWGNWFANTNSVWAWHVVLDDPALRRNPRLPVAVPWKVLEPDRHLFPISPIRARFNDLDNAGLATSANSPTPYRDELFGPLFPPSIFVSEPVHNVVHRLVIEPDGVSFDGARAPDEADREFLASSDEWFRPTMIRTGPDGALWIADMYRAVIEHPEWIPDDWEAKLDLRAGHDMGRIYRVVPVDQNPRPIPDLSKRDAAGLVAAIDSPNGWQRDTAMRLLLHREETSAAPGLKALAANAKRPQARLQALATLACLGKLDDVALLRGLADAHPEVRRFCGEKAGARAAQAPEIAEALLKLADDPAPRARMGAALGLGDWDDARAGRALARILRQAGDDAWLRTAALSSARPHAATILAELAADPKGADAPASVVDPLLALILDEKASGSNNLSALVRTLTTPRGGSFEHSQLAAMAGLLDAAARRGDAAERLAEALPEAERAEFRASLARLADAARARVSDDDAPTDARLAAARLLGHRRLASPESLAALADVLRPQVPDALQRAAVEAITRADPDHAATRLLDGWKAMSPALRDVVLGALLARPTTASGVLFALEDGCVPASEIGSAHRQTLLKHPDAKLRARAEALWSAPNAERAQVIEKYRAELAKRGGGSPAAGEAVFRRACAACHRLKEIGNEVGPDLAALTDRSEDALLTAILDPNRAVESRFAEYAVSTADGRVLNGIIVAESANSLTLRRQEGHDDVLLRADLDEVASTGRSLMPEGLERDLNAKDVADVLAFVVSAGPPPKQVEGNAPALVRPDAVGSVILPARSAEIYGASLTFEPQYGNLGYWSSADDRAAWTFETAHPGEYQVVLDYACDPSAAGNGLVLVVDGRRIEWTVVGTASWDEYKKARIGRVSLDAGRHRVEVLPGGAIRGALIDLRAVEFQPQRAQGSQRGRPRKDPKRTDHEAK
jgi:putative membrane-bound dehydrogenase-like protein